MNKCLDENKCPGKNEFVFVHYTSGNKTITYAARELSKYLGQMGGFGYFEPILRETLRDTPCDTTCVTNDDTMHDTLCSPPCAGSNVIKVGLFEELGIESLGVEDVFLDDEIYIDINGGNGVISGINPRSVLLSAYRML